MGKEKSRKVRKWFGVALFGMALTLSAPIVRSVYSPKRPDKPELLQRIETAEEAITQLEGINDFYVDNSIEPNLTDEIEGLREYSSRLEENAASVREGYRKKMDAYSFDNLDSIILYLGQIGIGFSLAGLGLCEYLSRNKSRDS